MGTLGKGLIAFGMDASDVEYVIGWPRRSRSGEWRMRRL